MDLVLNDWKHKIRKNPCWRFFCFNNKSTKKIKGFQKLPNKEIYFTLLSNNTKYINPF